jgi:para-aminobenzoate synthetase component 1
MGFGEALRGAAGGLWATLKLLPKHRDPTIFLVSRALYADGKLALLIFGGVFAAGVMRWGVLEMLAYGVLLSIFAVAGGYIGGRLDRALGPKRAVQIELLGSLLFMMGILGGGREQILYVPVDPAALGKVWNGPLFTTWPEITYLLCGFGVAVFVTACYASSRTLLVRLAPPALTGSFFGLYALSGAATAWLGPDAGGRVHRSLRDAAGGLPADRRTAARRLHRPAVRQGGRPGLKVAACLRRPWRDPAAVAAAFADEPYALALIGGRWSYVLREPRRSFRLDGADPTDAFAELAALLPAGEPPDEGPPFSGGVAGLLSYEVGARVEATGAARDPAWPDLSVGLYDGLLAFDRESRTAWAVGRGDDLGAATTRAEAVAGWLDVDAPPPATGPLARSLEPDSPPARYEAAVADVVRRIGEGEIFQANIAQGWRTRLGPGVRPFDVFARLLTQSPAPFAATCASPARRSCPTRRSGSERAARVLVTTQPIKGTRPRAADPAAEGRLAAELLASAKGSGREPDDRRSDAQRPRPRLRPSSVRAPECSRSRASRTCTTWCPP